MGEDIEDLEYTPKPEFEGCFKVKNVKNEVLLQRLFNGNPGLPPIVLCFFIYYLSLAGRTP